MVIRTAVVLTACGLIGTSLSGCTIVPEPPPAPPLVELRPIVPLPPRRPHFARVHLGHRVEVETSSHRFLSRPKVLRVKPTLGLRPTRPIDEPQAPKPGPPPVRPPVAADPQEGWGAMIPGSVPIRPNTWGPPPRP